MFPGHHGGAECVSVDHELPWRLQELGHGQAAYLEQLPEALGLRRVRTCGVPDKVTVLHPEDALTAAMWHELSSQVPWPVWPLI